MILPPVPRYALLVGRSATMLARGAICDARLVVFIQNKLIRALTLVRSHSGLTVSFEQVRAGGWRDETEMRAAAVVFRAGIVVG